MTVAFLPQPILRHLRSTTGSIFCHQVGPPSLDLAHCLWTFDRRLAYAADRIPSWHRHEILHWVGTRDEITHANFADYRFRRFRVAGVEFQGFPVTFDVVLITLILALKGYFTYCNCETKLVLHIDRAISCSVWKICELCVPFNY